MFHYILRIFFFHLLFFNVWSHTTSKAFSIWTQSAQREKYVISTKNSIIKLDICKILEIVKRKKNPCNYLIILHISFILFHTKSRHRKLIECVTWIHTGSIYIYIYNIFMFLRPNLINTQMLIGLFCPLGVFIYFNQFIKVRLVV